jgi:tetratricopeptide (TPR) repeat protein
MPTLQERLGDGKAQADDPQRFIRLKERVEDIRNAAPNWLVSLKQNDISHSERVEARLNELTRDLDPNLLSPADAFVLIGAAYLHDIGKQGGAAGHARCSAEMILNNPRDYLLGDFLPQGGVSLPAKAVAIVCEAHDHAKPLDEVTDEFSEGNLSPGRPLDLKFLSALLRLADEADDPYVRLQAIPGTDHFRALVTDVFVEAQVIRWACAPDLSCVEFDKLVAEVEAKNKKLEPAIRCVKDRTGVRRYLFVPRPPHLTAAAGPVFMTPKPVKTFVGRIEPVAEVHSRLSQAEDSLVAIVGTGGLGKSELAKTYAYRHRADYPGGVFWAGLKGSDWRTQAAAILSKLGAGGERPAFPDEAAAIEAVKQALAGRRDVLLIIDNVTEGVQVVEPGCRVLVTTRERHALPAGPKEDVYDLPVLSLDEGLDLLKKVLGQERVKQDVDGARQLIQILGGLALAVDIAAQHLARARDLDFPTYIGSIRGKLAEVKLGDSPEKNVAASLMVSLEQLGEEGGVSLAHVFEAASVCAESGFSSRTLAAAAGLKAADAALAGHLAGMLADRSLLHYDEKARRYTLHALLRQLAEVRLAAEPERERRCRENYCLHWLHYAQAHSANPDALIYESEGLWEAMVQANRIYRGGELLPRFLEALSGPYRKHLQAGEYELAFLYLMLTDVLRVDELGLSRPLVGLLEPLFERRASLSKFSQCQLLNSLGVAYGRLGEYGQAIGLFEEGLEIARRLGDARSEEAALGNLGIAHKSLGEHSQALKLYEQVLAIARRIGDLQGEGNVLGCIGAIHAAQGEHRQALHLHEQRLEIARRIGDTRGEAGALGSIGSAYFRLDEPRQAIVLYEQALEIHRRMGDLRGEADVLASVGNAYSALGKDHRAMELHEQALEIYRRIGFARGEAAALGNMGLTYASLGDRDKARECLEAARAVFERLGLGHEVQKIDRNVKALGLTD